ncbi:unnamed protein product [Orchesella dallaii]|uniref:Very-long-chain 3-oxoacyl-CoA synthase n=1 Tax=Orchesella dallaii TaxID=48710 RepID=A0ABP1QBW9_9HEXA
MNFQVMPYSEPIFRWYGVMNYGIHAIMYPYFALKVLGVRIRREVSMIITGLQMTQFLVGVGLNVYSVHVISKKAFYFLLQQCFVKLPLDITYVVDMRSLLNRGNNI